MPIEEEEEEPQKDVQWMDEEVRWLDDEKNKGEDTIGIMNEEDA